MQHVNITKGVRKFKSKIKKSNESIFNKANGFKWGCGRKCDEERQLLNVFKEKSKGADQKIVINGKKKINKLFKGRRWFGKWQRPNIFWGDEKNRGKSFDKTH